MRRIKFNKYAGVSIKGTVPANVDCNNDGIESNIEKAAWITSQVESGGMFGTVMNYDGTAITAGAHQATAVYPNLKGMPQGMLWKLLEDIGKSIVSWGDEDSAAFHYIELMDLLLKNGAHISNGTLFCTNGEQWHIAKGHEIRFLLSGASNGCMPIRGEDRKRAENFVQLFHNLFSHEETFETQVRFGFSHFEKILNRKVKIYGFTINDFFDYSPFGWINDSPGIEYAATSLAMSVFLSHSVNAPSMAYKVLCKAVDEMVKKNITDPTERARLLIAKLGNTKYGRWDDDLKTGRYQRTLKFAKKVYPKELFVGADAVMPKDLKG